MIGVRLQEPGQEHRVIAFTSEPGVGEPLQAFRDWYAEHHRRYLWIGFNSLQYDNHIVAAILEGKDDPTELKALSDSLINSNNGFRRNDKPSAGGEICVDPFSINGGARAKVGSLKGIACKLDAPSLRELPFEPDCMLTRDEMAEVAAYNAVDLAVTSMVAACQAATIAGRIAMAREYKSRRLINSHDAKLAVQVLALRMFGKDQKPTYPKTQSWSLSARQLATDNFTFRSPVLIELVGRLPEEIAFAVEIATADDGSTSKKIAQSEIVDSVKIGGLTCNIGSGGLHSADEPALFIADDVWGPSSISTSIASIPR